MQVNDRLREMNFQFLQPLSVSVSPSVSPSVSVSPTKVDKKAPKDFSGVQSGDVVVLPAFGATIEEMRLLAEREVTVIDTTCPWVSKVWNAVDNHRKVDTYIRICI